MMLKKHQISLRWPTFKHMFAASQSENSVYNVLYQAMSKDLHLYKDIYSTKL